MKLTPLFHIDPPTVADAGTEHEIQSRFVARLKNEAPTIRFVAVPNGGGKGDWERLKNAREGVNSGFPDGMALWCNGGGSMAVPGLFIIEFKARAGSLHDRQYDWLNWLTLAGFHCGVFRSVETAIAALRKTDAPFLIERRHD